MFAEYDAQLLLVEDNHGDAFLFQAMLEDEATDVNMTHVPTLNTALEHLAGASTDIIVLDMGLPDAHELEGVKRITERFDGPLLVLTGNDNEQLALEALQSGAQDYLVKDEINARTLRRALQYALERYGFARRLREAEEQQFILARELDMERRLSRFVKSISHEFRTPLSIIEASSYALDRADTELLQRRQARISNSVRRLTEIVDYVVKITNLHQYYEQGARTSVSLALRQLRDSSPERARVEIVDAAHDLLVSITDRHLIDLLDPLLDNALRYSEADATVTIHAEDGGDWIDIVIVDVGGGIPKDELVNVLAPFYKLDKARTRVGNEGPGIGLTLAAALTELADGALYLESKEDEGTTVTVTLPKSITRLH